MKDANISAEFPFESRFVTVHGSSMHCVESGIGDPIVFLHGNPTSSYLWRNVIPHLSPLGRCVAPDLIGMGRSGKPEIEYRFFDHAVYFEGFLQALVVNGFVKDVLQQLPMELAVEGQKPISISLEGSVG